MTTAAEKREAAKAEANGSKANGEGSTPTGLLGRLFTAQKAVVPPGKQGRNEKQSYDYVKAEDLISAARKALHDAGLVATMTYTGSETREVKSRSGGDGLFVMLRGSLRIADPDSGDSLEVPGFGAGIDYPGDKAVYKAQTGAAKYAFASALGMAMGDDPETDQGVPADAGQAPPPEERKLPADKVTALEKIIAEADLTEHLAMKLRGFGVSKIADLTVEQGISLFEWASTGQGGGE